VEGGLTRPGSCLAPGQETLSSTVGVLIHMRKSSMESVAKRFVREEVGEDLIEYGLLVAFMAAVAVAVIISDPLSLETAVTNAYQDCADALNSI
jgi:Flp pilus assembly pilin Flp